MALHIAKQVGVDISEEVANLKAKLAKAEKGKTDSEEAFKELQKSIDAAQASAKTKPVAKVK